MRDEAPIVTQIFDEARRRGISQSDLARQSNLPKETLSRIKKNGSGNLESIQAVAASMGLHLGLVPRKTLSENQSLPFRNTSPVGDPETRSARISSLLANRPRSPQEFRSSYAVQFAWSNTSVADDLLIQKVLLTGQFLMILDACNSFGVARVNASWQALLNSEVRFSAKMLDIISGCMESINRAYRLPT